MVLYNEGNNQGAKIMTKPLDESRQQIEQALYDYACDLATAKEVQATANRLGWTIDLRHWSGNAIEALAPNSTTYIWIEV